MNKPRPAVIRAGRVGMLPPGAWISGNGIIRRAGTGAMPREAVALKLRALAVALSLKADTLDPHELEALRRQAEGMLQLPVARAARGFCEQVIEARADRPRQVELAADMLRYLELATMPDVPGADRRDLNG
ncbi:hypothetical protein [Mameliella alba]|uniref:hypothetical protein n=1 Tax=Mameliella alba TaxID=561184 RepID=UPI000944BA36|nr:hypothetical protein [Mameliella alba]OWV46468.1 hypothetical protein CDZ96_17805 [Mameliella alba]GGF73489.1 hypothetical protein GCM10011319_37480 [Mameliella alba]